MEKRPDPARPGIVTGAVSLGWHAQAIRTIESLVRCTTAWAKGGRGRAIPAANRRAGRNWRGNPLRHRAGRKRRPDKRPARIR